MFLKDEVDIIYDDIRIILAQQLHNEKVLVMVWVYVFGTSDGLRGYCS